MNKLSPDNVLLGLLASHPEHGYRLLEIFRDPEHLGLVWNLSTSQLYAVLKRLEGEGLIAGQQVESTDAPARTIYDLTDAGRFRVEAWLNEPRPSASIRQVRADFLSRLYIARLLNRPISPLIKRQHATCQEQFQTLLERRARTAPGIGSLALDFTIRQLDGLLHWLEETNFEGYEP